MDDGKRENNKIKKAKSENVKMVLSTYLHRRQFPSPKPMLISKQAAIKKMNLSTRIRRQNSIVYNFISDCDPLLTEYSFVFQQFTLWLKDQIRKTHQCHDIEILVGPLFCHFYLDIRSSGKTHEAVSSSNSFFKTHIDKVDQSKCNDLVKGILRAVSAASDNIILNGSDCPSFDELTEKFRSSKVRVQLKPESLKLLKNFVAASSHIESHILILQSLKSWFDFHVISKTCELENKFYDEENKTHVKPQSLAMLQDLSDHLHPYINFDDRKKTVKNNVKDSVSNKDEKMLPLLNDGNSAPKNLPRNQNKIVLEKLNSIIDKARKILPSFCNMRIISSKNFVTCGLLRRRANLVIFAENNILRVCPSQVLSLVPETNELQVFPSQLEPQVLSDSAQDIEKLDHVRFSDHSKQIYSIALCPRNDIICTGSADCTICVYSLSELKLLGRLYGHSGFVYCVAISGNSKYIASGSHDSTVRLWNLRTGKLLRLFAGHTDAVICIHFHPNSMYLASGSSDKNVRMWCINSGNSVRMLHGSKKDVYAIAFSPNGLYIACASDDKKVRVWELSTSKVIHEFKNKESSVIHLLWSDNCQKLCGGTVSGVVKIWEVRDKDQVKENKHCDSVLRRRVSGYLLGLDCSVGNWSCLSVPKNSPFVCLD